MNQEQARFNMIEQQIRPSNVNEDRILKLLSLVKREDFVRKGFKNIAFYDVEIPLPGQQKMLTPIVEARMVQALDIRSTDKILEIGTGSGFVTSLLAKLADFVYSIESDEANREQALRNLTYSGLSNIKILDGDGLIGCKDKAPFNKIFIGGGVAIIPDCLKQQLAIGGKIVAITGSHPVMHITVLDKTGANSYKEAKLFETDVEYLTGQTDSGFNF